MSFPVYTLYAKDQNGGIRMWSVTGDDDGLVITHGLLNGEHQVTYETVDDGLAGRSWHQQVCSRIESRRNKKIDSGYTDNLEKAKNQPRLNANGYKRPMLAKKYRDVMDKIDFDREVYFAQPKFNGNRCLITNHNGTLVSYSRNGKINDRLDHIIDKLELPVGTTIDGELYHHGTSLQTINSWIKKKSPETKKLKLMVYDIMINTKYHVRMDVLDKNINWCDVIQKCPTFKIKSHEELNIFLNDQISNKYEGAMLRADSFGYEDGKRSNSLIKVKKFDDDEFEVVGFDQNDDGWAIAICKMPDSDKTFRATAPGSVYNKCEVWDNRDKYIGKFLNIEYPEYTDKGIPFQPVAKYWRDIGSE